MRIRHYSEPLLWRRRFPLQLGVVLVLVLVHPLNFGMHCYKLATIYLIIIIYHHINVIQVNIKQAQRRAAAETDAFIGVVRYNDESSFNLDNDFEMNPASTKTWPYMGPIRATIWGPYEQPIWAHTVFVHLFHIGPMWVPHMGPRSCTHFPRYCPHFCPVGPGTVLVRLF